MENYSAFDIQNFMCLLILIYYFKVLVPLPVTIPQCRGLYDFDVEDENDKKDCLCFKKVKLLDFSLFAY